MSIIRRPAAWRVAFWSLASVAAFALLIVPVMVVAFHRYDSSGSWLAELRDTSMWEGALWSTKGHLLIFPAAFAGWAWLSRRVPRLDCSPWALAGFALLVPAGSVGLAVYSGAVDRAFLPFLSREVAAYCVAGWLAIAGPRFGIRQLRLGAFSPPPPVPFPGLRRIAAAAVIVGLLWLATWRVGVPAATEEAAADLITRIADREQPRSHWVRLRPGEKPPPDTPTYLIDESRALAPFVITLDTAYSAGFLSGAGGREWYFWIPGHPFLICRTMTWIA